MPLIKFFNLNFFYLFITHYGDLNLGLAVIKWIVFIIILLLNLQTTTLIILNLKLLDFFFLVNFLLNDFSVLHFVPTHEMCYLKAMSKLLADLTTEKPQLTSTEWAESKHLYNLIIILTENFFSYNDVLLLLAEIDNIYLLSDFNYYNWNKLWLGFFMEESNFLHKCMNFLKGINTICEPIWKREEIHLAKISEWLANADTNENYKFDNFVDNYAFYKYLFPTNEPLYLYFKEKIRQSGSPFTPFSKIGTAVLDDLNIAMSAELFKKFFFTQLLVLNLIVFVMKKKIFFFFSINCAVFIIMLWNLIWLASANNLIYSLIHFLFFAVLSGLLLLLWGATYIGFCVLLIYGAAIPVLALYIIMLVNVDLIQRLFFIEHQTNKYFFKKFKIFLIFFIFFIFFTSIFFEIQTPNFSDLLENNLQITLFYLLLSKRYMHTLNISYSTESIYDLTTTFYSSDLDKVASAAFWVSSNELIALVLLLLISIIVVVGISWTSKQIDHDFYESEFINLNEFNKFWSSKNSNIFAAIRGNYFAKIFFKKKNLPHAYANFQNSTDNIYLPYFTTKITDISDSQQVHIFQFLKLPDVDWYEFYLINEDKIKNFLLKTEEFEQCKIIGNDNPQPEDSNLKTWWYGLLE